MTKKRGKPKGGGKKASSKPSSKHSYGGNMRNGGNRPSRGQPLRAGRSGRKG